jgi:hypothetical protein
MDKDDLSLDYFEHNGFQKIDDSIIMGCQGLAEKSFNSGPFKTTKKNCVIVFKQNDNLYSQVKSDYNSSIRQAKKLLEQSINSIIYIFTNYPKTVKHHIISDSALSIPEDYEGKGQTFIKDVKDIDTTEPFNPANN